MIMFRFVSSWIDTMCIAIVGRTKVYSHKMDRIKKLLINANVPARKIDEAIAACDRALAPVVDATGKEKPAPPELFHKFFQDLKRMYPNALRDVVPIHESVLSLEAWGWLISAVAFNSENSKSLERYANPNPKSKKDLACHALLLQLPTYYGLLQAESRELFGSDKWAPLMGLIVIGHFFTKVGRKACTLVLIRYYIFICVCLGYWSDTRKACFGLFESTLYSSGKRITKPSEDAKRFHLLSQNSKSSGKMSEYLRAVVAPRAILLQIVPHLTILSIFAAATAGSPLLVTDPELSRYLHPLLSMKSTSKINWIKALEMVVSLFNESRIATFILQGYTVAVSVYILYFPVGRMVLLSVALLLPFCFVKGLGVVISLGKFFEVDTGDLFCVKSVNPKDVLLAQIVTTILDSLKVLGIKSSDEHDFTKMDIKELRAWKIRIRELLRTNDEIEKLMNGRNSISGMQGFDENTAKLYESIDGLIEQIEHAEGAPNGQNRDEIWFRSEGQKISSIEMNQFNPPRDMPSPSRQQHHHHFAMWRFIDKEGYEQGPFDSNQMRDWALNGYLNDLTWVRLSGAGWRSFYQIRDVFPSINGHGMAGEQPFSMVPREPNPGGHYQSERLNHYEREEDHTQRESDFRCYPSSHRIDDEENPLHGGDWKDRGLRGSRGSRSSRGSVGLGDSFRRLNPGASSMGLPTSGRDSEARDVVSLSQERDLYDAVNNPHPAKQDDPSRPLNDSMLTEIDDSVVNADADAGADGTSHPQKVRLSLRDSIGPSLADNDLAHDYHYPDAQLQILQGREGGNEERTSHSAPVSSGNRFGTGAAATRVKLFARPPGALARVPSEPRGGEGAGNERRIHSQGQSQSPHHHEHQSRHSGSGYPPSPAPNRGSWTERMSTGSIADSFMRSPLRDSISSSSSRRAQL